MTVVVHRGRFKPLQSGAGFLCHDLWVARGRDVEFQTPSERGGIPLVPPRPPHRNRPSRFKPLQSGAGFLWYERAQILGPCYNVSNPFRAGRDSSASSRRTRRRPRQWCFKPLQSGAGFLWVVSTTPVLHRHRFQTPSERGGIPLSGHVHGVFADLHVSNPFRAGRDSSVWRHSRGWD